MKNYGFIILSVLCLGIGCSGTFPRLEQGTSGNRPKQNLIAPLIPRSSIVGEFNSSIELASPVIVGNIVYQGSIHDAFLAVYKNTGRVVWKVDIPGGVEAGASYFDQKIYFGANDGNFYCLDAATGKVIWKYQTKVETFSTPVIRGGIVYFSTVNNGLYALKSNTGEYVWYFNKGYIQKISVRGSSSPVYHDGKIYIGFSDGYFYVFNAFDGKTIWFKKLSEDDQINDKFIDVDVTPIIGEKEVFVGSFDGSLYALDLATGSVRWKFQQREINGITANDHFIYATTSTRTVFCLKRTTGQKVWEQMFPKSIPTNPILVEDQLIVATSEDYVYSLSTENGSEIWQYNLDSGVNSQPVLEGEKLYIFTNLSTLHIIDPFYLIPRTL